MARDRNSFVEKKKRIPLLVLTHGDISIREKTKKKKISYTKYVIRILFFFQRERKSIYSSTVDYSVNIMYSIFVEVSNSYGKKTFKRWRSFKCGSPKSSPRWPRSLGVGRETLDRKTKTNFERNVFGFLNIFFAL